MVKLDSNNDSKTPNPRSRFEVENFKQLKTSDGRSKFNKKDKGLRAAVSVPKIKLNDVAVDDLDR